MNTITTASGNYPFTGLANNASYKVGKPPASEIEAKFSTVMKSTPYSYLADENGVIQYNGVTFISDKRTNSINLGDTSVPGKTLNIPLADGGLLKVNVNALGDLPKAIGMFSPEDVNSILRAIAQESKIAQMKNEIEEEKDKVPQADVKEGDG